MEDIKKYNAKQTPSDRKICEVLSKFISENLPGAESKIWHAHPVWFLNGNPTVGYSKLKDCVRLMFWSGADFNENALKPGTGRFKDASIRYTDVSEVNTSELKKWLKKSEKIQWDYKNIVKRKGKLVKILP